MCPSYDQINYNLRPAKSIERKMLCEAFGKLAHFSDLDEYRYVGFGSPYFNDFTLLHKSFGITDLVSIEKEEGDKDRFEFNRPYRCVNLIFGESNDVLPNLKWSKKVILWLDYDYQLDQSMLEDIGTFFRKAQTGSIILLTLAVKPDEYDARESRYDKLEERVGISKIPNYVKDKDLDKKGFAKVCYEIINNEIEEMSAIRNGVIKDNLCIYKQLFNFIYQDGSTPMLTMGGIIYSENEEDKIKRCNFKNLSFIKSNMKEYRPYKIIVPKLTFREMSYLDKILPVSSRSMKNLKGDLKFLSNKSKKDYRKYYRYFPNFVEAEIR